MGKHYTEADFAEIIEGKVAPPNFEETQLAQTCGDIAARGHMMTVRWGASLLSDYPDWKPASGWTMYFLLPPPGTTIGFGGGGYLIRSRYGYHKGLPHLQNVPIVGRFAICKHEKEEGAGANHSRGYHPGKCRLCGMDMTVDSGD